MMIRGNSFTGSGATRRNEDSENKKKSVTRVQSPTCVIDSLNILFTNADSLVNKRIELESRIHQNKSKPDIIGIVEANPKNCKYGLSSSEFSVEGYDVHHTNITDSNKRGIVLYTAVWLRASPYLPEVAADESVWITIKLSGNDKLLVGCVYRSPSSDMSNDDAIHTQIKTSSSNTEFTHLLIMGDFNYPNIKWDSYSISSESGSGHKFLNTVKNVIYISMCSYQPEHDKVKNLVL